MPAKNFCKGSASGAFASVAPAEVATTTPPMLRASFVFGCSGPTAPVVRSTSTVPPKVTPSIDTPAPGSVWNTTDPPMLCAVKQPFGATVKPSRSNGPQTGGGTTCTVAFDVTAPNEP